MGRGSFPNDGRVSPTAAGDGDVVGAVGGCGATAGVGGVVVAAGGCGATAGGGEGILASACQPGRVLC